MRWALLEISCSAVGSFPGFKVIKLFNSQLSMKFIMLLNVKMPTFVLSSTFISMINTTSESLRVNFFLFFSILVFISI